MIGLAVNIILAFLWVQMTQWFTWSAFLFGFLFGLGLELLFMSAFGKKRILHQYYGFIRFLVLFFIQYIKANLEVARLVLFIPTSKFHSGFLNYSIDDMTYAEALLLSHCITLTPGTITALFNWEEKFIRVHVLDYTDSREVESNLNQSVKPLIWGFTR